MISLENKGGLLFLTKENKTHEVQVCQCFPWSCPNEFLSLKDKEGKELHLVESLNDLSKSSRVNLEEYLGMLNFTFKISEILEIEEEVELRSFKVITQQGSRCFQTKLEDWPLKMNDGSVLIKDLSGDLFKIENPDHLDKKSKTLLNVYID